MMPKKKQNRFDLVTATILHITAQCLATTSALATMCHGQVKRIVVNCFTLCNVFSHLRHILDPPNKSRKLWVVGKATLLKPSNVPGTPVRCLTLSHDHTGEICCGGIIQTIDKPLRWHDALNDSVKLGKGCFDLFWVGTSLCK